MMNDYTFMLFFFLILVFFVYYKNKKNRFNKEKINSTILPIYKLGDNKYITSAHYIDYEKAINLILYSDSNNITFTYCAILYASFEDECKPKMQSDRSLNYYRIELNSRKNDIPLRLYINNITINFNQKKRIDSDSYIVCMPIIVNLERPLMLIQVFESYKIFGVKKVVVNYHSSSKEVINVLNYYNRLGFVDIYQYNNSVDEKFREIELDNYNYIYHFQMWKINHCYYEYRAPKNHIMVLDVDEILWPVKARNYYELFRDLPKMDFYFVHEFFYKIDIAIADMNDHNITLPDIDIFSISNYCPTPNKGSSKYISHKYIIYNTEKVIKAQVHEGYFKRDVRKQYIPNDIAYVRHTRHYNFRINEMCKSSLVKTNLSLIEYILQNNTKCIYRNIIRNV